MADSVSKMVTPSEIFGFPVGPSSRNPTAINTSQDKTAKTDTHPMFRTLSTRFTVPENQAAAAKVLPDTDNTASEDPAWNTCNDVSDVYPKLLSKRQEAANQDHQEPMYYIVAGTGTNNPGNVQITSNNPIPLMVMNRQGSLSSAGVVQSSKAQFNQSTKPSQHVLPQVFAMMADPTQVSGPNATERGVQYSRFQQPPPESPAVQSQAPLDPDWLKALANLLHLHVTNNGNQALDDSPDGRMVPDQPLISTLAATKATSQRAFASSGPRSASMSNTVNESYGLPGIAGARRNALAEIQPYGIPTRTANSIKVKETQTLPRVMPQQYATKRQLVFVSPLTTEQESGTKMGANEETETRKDVQASTVTKQENELPNWPAARDSFLDTGRPSRLTENDREDSCSSEADRIDLACSETTASRNFVSAQKEQTGSYNAVKRSQSAVALDGTDETVDRQTDNEGILDVAKRNPQHGLLRQTLTKTEVLKTPPFPVSPVLNDEGEARTVREKHNLKERKRRARIKGACDLMRKIVPGMSEKTDKATVFEFSARYIHYLKSQLGNGKDKDFLLKYSPY